MGDGDRGFRGGRRGEPGHGARGPGPAPGRGGGRGGDRKFSWKRDDGDNNNSSTSNLASGSDDTSRWEEAAMGKQTTEGGIWVPKSQGSSGSAGEGTERQISTPLRRNQGSKANQVNPSSAHDPCPICKSREHARAFCVQAFCERYGRLGHLASVCCEFLPWSCAASMCAFQTRGQGFYYIHDSCSANLMKERSNNIVVSIVEGETSTRQMELGLNDYLATGWRCSAHAIGPGVFVVRFPNPRDVAQICYVGRIVLKTSGAVVNVTKWSSAVGSKGVMEVAWVKVSNVPLDKRSERNMAYVASLVGVPLEIDYATLHRPASARVKIGCRSVDEIPSVAEAVLGEHFYDFYFEVDQILVRDPNRGESLLSADEKPVSVNCSDGDMNKKMRSPVSEIKSFADVVRITPQVVPVDAERGECDAGKVEYMVESPDNVVDVEVIPTPPLATEENLRFSLRNVQSKMEDVQLKADVVVKKRNAEGTLHSHNSFDALSNQNMMLAASTMGVIIPDNDFVNIDIIRELEKFRNNNSRVEREDVVEAEEDFNNMSLINANGVVTPLELGWMEEGNMEEDDFTIAKSIWDQVVRADDPIDILNIKLKRIKKYFKGWGSNRFGHSKKRKDEIKKELEEIEKMEEIGPLDPEKGRLRNTCVFPALWLEWFYTFGLAAVCWALWNCRNRATFERKKLGSPFDVVYSTCGFLTYWAGLLTGDDKLAMERGAKMLKRNASNMLRICAAPEDGC
ncbi:hypothetical protein D1007_50672 [Hordeum vulgare]|nr:hypothetical protein D1007_50672 [Hordeum vulgare]